jgi:hypothetical protein
MPRADASRKHCAIYTRKSSEEGLEQEFNSLAAQREASEAFIRSQQHEGWVLARTRYDDGGFSGGNLQRPALQHRNYCLGMPAAEIRLLIKDPQTGEPIGLETLHKHFAEEIATGAVKANCLVADRILGWILGRDGGLQDERARVWLAILFAKARLGWTVAKRCGGCAAETP